MDILLYLLAAVLIGWLTTDLVQNRPMLFINVFVSVVGAFLAGMFLTPYLDAFTLSGPINLKTFLISFAGSAVLLFFFNISKPNRHRW